MSRPFWILCLCCVCNIHAMFCSAWLTLLSNQSLSLIHVPCLASFDSSIQSDRQITWHSWSSVANVTIFIFSLRFLQHVHSVEVCNFFFFFFFPSSGKTSVCVIKSPITMDCKCLLHPSFGTTWSNVANDNETHIYTTPCIDRIPCCFTMHW